MTTTITTTSAGLSLTVDSASCTSPYTYQWTSGSNHTIAVASSPQSRSLVTRKRLTVTADAGSQGNPMIRSRDLDTAQTYDNEGKVMTVKYLDTLGFNINSNYVALPGATYTYGYDGMSRPITLVDDRSTPVNWVNNVQYGPANELKQMDYRIGDGLNYGQLSYQGYYTETRQYNNRLQMTRLATGLTGFSPMMDMEYRYSAAQNNGQITQQKEWATGEEVTYQYNSLQRLISAVTTGPEWGQSFTLRWVRQPDGSDGDDRGRRRRRRWCSIRRPTGSWARATMRTGTC